MLRTIFSALLLSVIFSGCTKIYFHNSGDSEVPFSLQETPYRHTAFRLVEISDPVSTDMVCREKEWSIIKTELSFADSLLSSIDDILLGGIDVYSQKTVGISCEQ